MKTKNLLPLAILSLAVTLGTGCTATLQHRPFKDAASAPKGPMAVSAHAKNMPARVGWGTFTVFAIPIAPVKVTGEADRELMNQLKDAVAHCGYSARIVESPGDAADLPLLTCEVTGIGFRNYTYFFPIVFNWGKMELALSIQKPDGRIIFHQTYLGGANGAYSFSSTVNKALTRLLDDAIADLARADYGAAGAPVCPGLHSERSGEVVRALKALRKLNAPDAVPEMLPLLQHKDTGIVRDTCRTLAVLGNQQTIASIEPLLNHSKSSVRKDAQDTIAALQSKR